MVYDLIYIKFKFKKDNYDYRNINSGNTCGQHRDHIGAKEMCLGVCLGAMNVYSLI